MKHSDSVFHSYYSVFHSAHQCSTIHQMSYDVCVCHLNRKYHLVKSVLRAKCVFEREVKDLAVCVWVLRFVLRVLRKWGSLSGNVFKQLWKRWNRSTCKSVCITHRHNKEQTHRIGASIATAYWRWRAVGPPSWTGRPLHSVWSCLTEYPIGFHKGFCCKCHTCSYDTGHMVRLVLIFIVGLTAIEYSDIWYKVIRCPRSKLGT